MKLFLFAISSAFSCLIGSSFGLGLGSQVPAPDERAPRGSAAAAELTSPVHLVGSIRDAQERPVSGAVVVTSAGGEAVTDANGEFALDVTLPRAAERVQVTAVASVSGASHAGSVLVGPLMRGTTRDAGVIAIAASSGCQPSWLPTFGGEPGMDGAPQAMAIFDDGTGPALYVGGDMITAAGVLVNHIARWNGSGWSPLGSGTDGSVRALAVFDDGGGPKLCAGGFFTQAGGEPAACVAAWDGDSWSGDLGDSILHPGVNALAVFDDGGGNELYAGGPFDAPQAPLNCIAKWDGAGWVGLAGGLTGASPMGPIVYALAVFDDGGGPALFAGGHFDYAGGLPVSSIARWDGASWSALAGGLGGGAIYGPGVNALAAFDDGTGPALFAGGYFDQAGGVAATGVAKWDGASWSAAGAAPYVQSFAVFDDGTGAALYAGSTTSGIAKWAGSVWSPLGTGVDGPVSALAVFDDGGGPALVAGGGFWHAGGLAARYIATWDGSEWSQLGSGLSEGVHAVAVFDDGGGPALYAGGDFASGSGVPLNHVARWSGESWSPLGSGTDWPVESLVVFDDGGGLALYAGGAFTLAGGVASAHVAKWDGAGWSALGSGIDGGVRALAVFDNGSGSALYAGGDFGVAGGISARAIARWDGAAWSALGSGVQGTVDCLAVFDDGGGPALFAGGSFLTAGGTDAHHVAKWDGASWSPLGSGLSGPVYPLSATAHALAVFDDGGGPALYAGGWFGFAGGVAASHVARWDGASWSPLGSGMNEEVRALGVFDAGGGPQLFAGGRFTAAGEIAASRIARWNGASWSPVEGGTTAPVYAFTVFHEGGVPALYAGGVFSSAFDSEDSYLAKWACAGPVIDVPGCFENPARLIALSAAASTGDRFALRFEAASIQSGVAVLAFGKSGTSPSGCGFPVPAIGEILLALSPGPFALAHEPIHGGNVGFAVEVPAQPALVGLAVVLQAAGASAAPPSIELSNGLVVTIMD